MGVEEISTEEAMGAFACEALNSGHQTLQKWNAVLRPPFDKDALPTASGEAANRPTTTCEVGGGMETVSVKYGQISGRTSVIREQPKRTTSFS